MRQAFAKEVYFSISSAILLLHRVKRKKNRALFPVLMKLSFWEGGVYWPSRDLIIFSSVWVGYCLLPLGNMIKGDLSQGLRQEFWKNECFLFSLRIHLGEILIIQIVMCMGNMPHPTLVWKMIVGKTFPGRSSDNGVYVVMTSISDVNTELHSLLT